MISERHKKTLENLQQAYKEAGNNFEQINGEFVKGSPERYRAYSEWIEAERNLEEFEDFLDELDARDRSKAFWKAFWSAFWTALVGTGMVLLLAGLIVTLVLIVAYETSGGIRVMLSVFLGNMIVIGLKVFTWTFKFAKEDSK